MHVSMFDFDLPPERIAHAPVTPRDAAKLLHVGKALSDSIVRELPALLSPGDVMVFNDSRVIPARLFADVGGQAHRGIVAPAACGHHGVASLRPASQKTQKRHGAHLRTRFLSDRPGPQR